MASLTRTTSRSSVAPASCAAFLVACLTLGGGTSVGFLSDALLQILAIPVLLACLWRLSDATPNRARWELLFCLGVFLIPLLQLVPLPPALWTALPGREPLAATFELLAREFPWAPISVSPRATWLSAMSLLPPLAVFLGTLLLSYRERRHLSIVVLTVGVLSVFLGLSQVAQGPKSALRFFEITNETEAVGFFANRNHFAALLYALTLLVAVWVAEAAAPLNAQRARLDAAWMLAVAASVIVLVVILAGQAMARSRTGLVLTIVALFGAFALALTGRRDGSGTTPAKLIAAAITLALMLGVQYALFRIAQRLGDDPLQDARILFARKTFEAAKAFMPFGSGMGTFAQVYALLEKPQDALLDVYANRAHNDLLELSLEAGVAGLGLMTLFIVWFLTRSVRVWARRDVSLGAFDVYIEREATLVVALLIAHSMIDYPLRTAAIMAITAFACGLLVEPLRVEETPIPEPQGRPRRATVRAESPALAVASAPQPMPQGGGQRWGEDVAWPTEWHREARTRPPRERND